jgi:hypothetical protein
MKQQAVLLGPNCGGDVLHNFMQSLYNTTVVCEVHRLAFQDEFFVKYPLDVKENKENALDVAFLLARLFRSR